MDNGIVMDSQRLLTAVVKSRALVVLCERRCVSLGEVVDSNAAILQLLGLTLRKFLVYFQQF